MAEPTDPPCVPITVHTFGLTPEAWDAVFGRVAKAAHELDEQLFTGGRDSCLQCEDEPPAPDWSDLRDMARKAGWTRRQLARDWWVWTDKDASVHLRKRWDGGWKITLAGEFGDLVLNQPTPARFLAIARELGIGGTS